MSKRNIPNPGSDEALNQGCICPVMDNGHGRGRGDGCFIMVVGCPINHPPQIQRAKEAHRGA